MSFLDTLLIPFGYRIKQAGDSRPATPIGYSSYDRLWGFASEQEEKSFTEVAELYSLHDLSFLCGNRLGDMAANAELQLFDTNAPKDPDTNRYLPEAALKYTDHPFYTLWNSPNKYSTTAFMLKQWTLVYKLSSTGLFISLDDGKRESKQEEPSFTGGGNEVTYKVSGPPVSLWTLLPHNITVKSSDDELVSHFLEKDANDPARKIKHSLESVMWLRDVDPADFLRSISMMKPSSQAVSFDRAATKANTLLFKNGLRPGPIIEADRDHVAPEELALLQSMWEEQLKGVDNWHKLLPLWGGFKISNYGFSPNEAEYTRGSELARMRIFGVWGVHPAIILSENVNRANAQIGELVTRRYTLAPLLRSLATGITHSILPLYESTRKKAGKQNIKVEAQFVNLNIEDEQVKFSISISRGRSVEANVAATKALVELLGVEEGLKEAKRLGVLSRGVEGKEVTKEALPESSSFESTGGSNAAEEGKTPPATQKQPAGQPAGQSVESPTAEPATAEVKFLSSSNGAAKQDPFPVEEDINLQITFTQEDHDWIEELFNRLYPEYAGLLTPSKR